MDSNETQIKIRDVMTHFRSLWTDMTQHDMTQHDEFKDRQCILLA
jgi:hypothetical protein